MRSLYLQFKFAINSRVFFRLVLVAGFMLSCSVSLGVVPESFLLAAQNSVYLNNAYQNSSSQNRVNKNQAYYNNPSLSSPVNNIVSGTVNQTGFTGGEQPRPRPLFSPPGQTFVSPPSSPPRGPGGYYPTGENDGLYAFGLNQPELRPTEWSTQIFPTGIIYKSYMAGPREARMGTTLFQEKDGRNLWDGTLGTRIGLIRFGNNNAINPVGWQLDAETAALIRLNPDENVDVESVDFRFGFPITYGTKDWQIKVGYYHLSSHLGDEFIIRNNAVNQRINYVRDALVFGGSYNLTPAFRVYGEAAAAIFFKDGGADIWEFQFGAEYAQPGVTSSRGTPFLAMNAHLREELDFGGDLTLQAGWLWRNAAGNTFRTGLHFVTGKSTQYQFYKEFEQQIGVGFWYDF